MIASHQGNSESALMTSLHMLADAGAPVIQIRTREPIRAAVILRKNLINGGAPYHEWDVTNGFRQFTTENYVDHKISGNNTDFHDALSKPMTDLRNPMSDVCARSEKIHFFAYLNPHPFVENNPIVIEMLQQYAAVLPSTNVCILLITPDQPLAVPVGTALVAELPTPGAEELKAVLKRVLDETSKGDEFEGAEFTEDDYDQIALLGLGLTLAEFETYCAISIIEASSLGDEILTPERIRDGVAKGKTEVVKQSEILELTTSSSIDDVGGMHRLKDWITSRANCYSEDAKAFGIEPPKGAALVGIPGAGKSLIAKSIAGVLHVPMVRLDFSRVFAKYVGESESRVRSALKMVEDMAPCVLFVDEIDKGLGGAAGGGDSGTGSRVLGSFLTWLNDCKAPVFTMVTANRIDGLPPELLRRGRFDAIFSVTLPNEEERKEVLAIHLRKRGRKIEDFSDEEIVHFLECSKDYVPSEIESAVKDALILAFADKQAKDLEMAHIVKALKDMVPMSFSHKAQIDRIIEWARENATPVNYDAATMAANAAKMGRAGSRRILKTSRRG